MSRPTRGIERVRRDEGGFTLVEVLIAVMIQALIMGALAMAFISILNGTKTVNQSLSRSTDARLAAAYFVTDAGNSSGPEVSLSDTTSCPDASPPVAGTASAVARFNWSSTSSAGVSTTNVVNYVLVSNSLLRRVCKNGTLLSDRAVASNVQSAVATCLPTANCSGTPASINVVVTSMADTSGNQFTYTLSGTFRKLNGAGPTAPSNPRAVITLGSGTNCSSGGTGISLTASASMRVYGDVFVNSVNAACKALSMTSNSTYQAGGTNMITGGTCASTTGASPCPTWNTYTTPLSDPYASLPVPSNGTSRSGCSGGVAQPGYYASGLSISGTSCQLASGVYVLNGGLSVAGTSSASASLTSASGGVFIYMTGSGAITTSSYSSYRTGTINLQPLTTGSYKGVSIWQAASNTTSPSLSSGSLTLGGVMYMPGAQFSINGANVAISSIVARTIWMANSGTAVFGTASSAPLALTGPSSYTLVWTVNRPYPSTTLTASGGDGNYTWTVTGLPTGVTADPVTGVVSGTPTSTCSPCVGSVTLSDLLGDDPLTGWYWLTVNPAPNISTSSLPGGDRTVAYSKTMSVSNGTPNYTWSATGLPAGLSMSSGGTISGTPTTAGTSTVNVTVIDAAGATDSQSFSLVISNPPTISTSSLASGTQGSSYTSSAMSASGGTTPYSWSASNLPSGLSMNSSTGVISGTPNNSGTTSVTVTVTDDANGTASKTLSITIAAGAPQITNVSLNNGSGNSSGTIEQGDSISVTFSKTMDVSDFCSSWSNDSYDQSLTSNNDVTVTVSNGSYGSHDSITVSSSSCSFHFGTIDMGSSGYVGSSTTFKGSYSSKSTIYWDVSAKTLTITLGDRYSGSASYVSGSTPVYTSSSSLSDTSGNAISNSPYTLSYGRKF